MMFEAWLSAVWTWMIGCFLLWRWAMSGWVRCAIRERRRAREQATLVLRGSRWKPVSRFGDPLNLTWTKSRGRVD